MIGDDYFQQRSQLGEILAELRAEVDRHSPDPETRIILDNLLASLKEPFVFVVVGEVNVGKSTFLNALFGQDFSRTGVVPTTDKILFFKYGDTEQRLSITPTLDEVLVPAPFLKNFHIVDTPGTNSIQDEHQQITERFVPASDLVIFVFSATNPWGASAWQFLERVHRDWMRNVVFVLQQADLRTPEEITVITDYMSQLTRQRFGRDFPIFPIFPVSAKHAYLARTSGVDREGLMRSSGFAVLEDYISRTVTADASRTSKLRTACQLARQRLNQVRHTLRLSIERTEAKTHLLHELANEREMQVNRTLKKIAPAVDATERDYHDSAIRVAAIADTTLSTQRAFRRPPAGDDDDSLDDDPPSLDHKLFQDLQHHNNDRWRQVAMILDEDVTHYERYLYQTGSAALFLADDNHHGASDDHRLELRRRFMARVDSAIRRFVVGLHLDEAIEPGFQKAAARARRVPILLIPITLGIAAGGYFSGWQTALVTAGCGALLLCAMVLLTKATLSSTRRLLIDKLDASSSQLHDLLSTQVTEDVTAAFARFQDLLAPAIEGTAHHQQTLAAQTARLDQLDHRFARLEESLHAPPSHS